MVYDYLAIPPVCVCDLNQGYLPAGDQCLLEEDTLAFTAATSQYAESRANQISYGSIETRTSTGANWSISSITHNSGTIQYYYLDAAVGCTVYKNIQKC